MDFNGGDDADFFPPSGAKPVQAARNISVDGHVENHVTLKIRYNCEPGEHMAVCGNIPELGQWKNFIELKWTEDNIWETKEPIKTRKNHFYYKFILMNNGQKVKFEEGVDRIADLVILPEIAHPSQAPDGIHKIKKGQYPIKFVEIISEWEAFNVIFSIYRPLVNSDDKMKIYGDQQLFKAGSHGFAPIHMDRSVKSVAWYNEKYGEGVKPYQAVVTVPNPQRANINDPLRVGYHYKFTAGGQKHEIGERGV